MLLIASFPAAEAGVTKVAVAANFTEPPKEIAALFKQKTGHEAILSFGASGLFLEQIRHDARFQVFLSADAGRAKAAIDGGYAFQGRSSPMRLGSWCCGARSSM
jgi:molybdate transport system substrate-binding protein